MKPAEQIITALTKALADLGIEGAEPTLERPADMAHGDYSTNIAFVAFKQWVKDFKPRSVINPPAFVHDGQTTIGSVAEVIVSELQKRKLSFIESINIAGPGFINFKLTDDYFIENLKNIDEDYGQGTYLSGKTVLVEYTQPNPFKPFHIGHLMSNAIGQSLSNIIENAGADVKRLNYQGDVGPHVAKALWGIQQLNADPTDIVAIGKAYVHGAQAYENDEKAKAEIDELNKKVYEDDESIREVYTIGKNTSLARFEELYEVLGTKFDRYYFESEVWRSGLALVEEGKTKGIFVESDGAIIFPGEQYGLHTRVFVSSKGIPLYEAKDLGLGELKAREFRFDESINVTAVEQEQYFQVVFKALGLLRPALGGRFGHIAHGMMQLAGGKMSSRLGNVVTGESLISGLISDVTERMGDRVTPELTEEVAQDVGVAAIKYTVLRQALRKNIIFDEERSLSFEGDSGPYIQYTTVRARSVVAKAKDAGIKASFDIHPETVGIVERMLERFPEVARRAAEDREPHHIATYLIDLSSAFNSWYAQEHIIDADDALSPYRVALTEAVSRVLARGLWLLGIRVPIAM